MKKTGGAKRGAKQTSGGHGPPRPPLESPLSPLLLFTQYKTTCLTVISSQCLPASPAIDV